MEQARSQAVVLRKVTYGEADLILTLLTRDLGKVSALARGARRSHRRFGASLELFTVSTVELRPHRGELWTLGSAETTTSFTLLARDMAALAHASYGTELVRELGAPEQPDPDTFDLLVDLYRALAARGARPDVLRVFELALLGGLGLAPTLDACAACGRNGPGALDRGALLDPARGGAICALCAPASRGGVRPLSSGARSVLQAAQRAGLARDLSLVTIEQGEDAVEARDAMLSLIHHHVGRPLRTLEFLGKLSRPVS
ncbi:MAG TPA: DNA repair protein RecO [Kofleriaceae bacterium]|nr:DNA repair protein RecO [Kofleriaceae bacterium]